MAISGRWLLHSLQKCNAVSKKIPLSVKYQASWLSTNVGNGFVHTPERVITDAIKQGITADFHKRCEMPSKQMASLGPKTLFYDDFLSHRRKNLSISWGGNKGENRKNTMLKQNGLYLIVSVHSENKLKCWQYASKQNFSFQFSRQTRPPRDHLEWEA